MKRVFMLVVLALFTIGPTMPAAAAINIASDVVAARWPMPPDPEPPWHPTWKPEGRWIGPCEGWWLGENLTQAAWNEDPARGATMMQRLIVCVFAVLAPGQSAYALAIADRESSFWPWAYNPSGASGLFQHIASYWPARSTLLNRGWFGKGAWPASVFDPRANAMVTAIMVRDGGWGPWT